MHASLTDANGIVRAVRMHASLTDANGIVRAVRMHASLTDANGIVRAVRMHSQLNKYANKESVPTEQDALHNLTTSLLSTTSFVQLQRSLRTIGSVRRKNPLNCQHRNLLQTVLVARMANMISLRQEHLSSLMEDHQA